jgi:hypothetical protein
MKRKTAKLVVQKKKNQRGEQRASAISNLLD